MTSFFFVFVFFKKTNTKKMTTDFDGNIEDYDEDDFDNEIEGKKGADLTTDEKRMVVLTWDISNLEWALYREKEKDRRKILEDTLAKKKAELEKATRK